MNPAAAARHRVLVILRDRRGDHRSIDDLVRRGDPEIFSILQVPAAAARALREQVPLRASYEAACQPRDLLRQLNACYAGICGFLRSC